METETRGDAQELNTKKNTEFRVYSQRQHPQQEVPPITILAHCQESKLSKNLQSKDTDPGILDSPAPSQDNSMSDYLDMLIALRKGARSCTRHPLYNFLSYKKLAHSFRVATKRYLNTEVPKTIQKALKIP